MVARGEDSDRELKQSPLGSSSADSPVIVVGFLGGFVHRDDPNHPEVRLIRELRQEYPGGGYFGLFENSNIDEAYQMIVRQLNVGDGNPLSDNKGQRARILLFGHSWGASAVVRLARRLDRRGIAVALTVQVDSVARPFSNDGIIPPNVSEAANFYQAHGLIHGRSRITAADGERTRIIGNFRRDYRTEPASCRNFSWYSRLFTKGHIAIECDPNVWFEVKTLLERHLSTETVTPAQLKVLEPHTASPVTQFGTECLQSKPIRRTDSHCRN